MAPFSWSRWLRSLFRQPSVRPFRKRRPRLLALEQLEHRLAPATYTWTGGGTTPFWSDPRNWQVNGHPGTPVIDGSADLVFPGGETQIGNGINNLATGTGGPATFNSLSFSDVVDQQGYVISGNPIILGNPSVPGSGFIHELALVPNVDIAFNIQLAGASGTKQFITVGGGATLTISGDLSGATNAELTKESQGTLILAGDNSQFTGPITVDVNGGVLEVANPLALGDSTNVTTVQTNGQLQIADLHGQTVPAPLKLNGAGPDNNGALVNLVGQNVLGGDIELDSDTTFGALAGNMTLTGVIGDLGAGHNVTKAGVGEVTFTGANTYRGSTTVNNGVLDIQNGLALGPGDGLAADAVLVHKTTDKNPALWVEDPTGVGFTVPNKLLTINGVGAAPLQRVVVSGPTNSFFTLGFPLDAPPVYTTPKIPVGASAATVQQDLNNLLNIWLLFGSVDVTQTMDASGDYVYDILWGGTFATMTNPSVPQLIGTGTGGATITVQTIRQGADGALRNVAGSNTWTGNVIQGSPLPNNVPPSIGSAEGSTLTVSGKVLDPVGRAPSPLTKVDTGTLIFTNSNTYGGGTLVAGGILEIQDSQGAGKGDITVQDGASFALGIDNIPDSITKTTNTLDVTNNISISGFGASVLGALLNISGTNVWAGNVTFIDQGADDLGPEFNPTGDLLDPYLDDWQTEPVDANGNPNTIETPFDPPGVDNTGNPATLGLEDPLPIPDPTPLPEGADDVPELGATDKPEDHGSIGVIGDPNPTPSNAYFPTYNAGGQAVTGDFSLTISGQLIGSETLQKYGSGNLILPNANNQMTGNINIVQGWVTIENNNSLGETVPDTDQNLQPTVTVEQGASLHFKGSAINPISITQNLVLDGQGINHTFGDLNQQGALENLSGINTVNSNVTLEGQDGIGVEKVFPGPSQLYLSGHIYDQPIVHQVAAQSPGGPGETDVFYDTGSTSGSLTISYNMYGLPDSMDVYYGIKGQGGVLATQVNGNTATTGGFVSGTGTFTINYAPIGTTSSTIIEVVMDAGGTNQLNTQWYFYATITPNMTSQSLLGDGRNGGITKLGSQLLVIQADGTYLGNVDIRQGVLLDQNNTGLGAGIPFGNFTPSQDPTVTVEPGAALALTSFVLPSENGTTSSGVDIWGEHLILNGPGNDTLGEPLGAVNVLATDQLTAPNDTTIVPADAMWRGPVTLQSSTTFNLDGGTRLLLLGNMDDATNPTGLGSDLIKVGEGEMVLEGQNSFRGNTYVGSPVSPPSFPVIPNDAPLPDVQQFEFSGSTGTFNLSLTFNGVTATTAIPLPFGDSASDVQSQILGLLSALGISGATVTVTQTGSYYVVVLGGSLAGNTSALLTAVPVDGDIVTPVPTVTTTQGGDPSLYFFNSTQPVPGGIVTVGSAQGLGAATGTVVVQNGSSLQLEANTTVAGKQLIVSGNGAPTVGDPLGVNWFSQGPAPIFNGPTLGKNRATLAGYVTDVAVDPTDPLTMFISTAGGGVWKTENGGKTWRPIFNDLHSSYVGVVALDPTDPLHVYIGTGLVDNSVNSFAGTGVYQSYDGGATWSLITNGDGSNPFAGRAITAIAFDVNLTTNPVSGDPDNNPANARTGAGPVVYIADSDQTQDGMNGQHGNPDPAIGVYRYDPQAGVPFNPRTGLGSQELPLPGDKNFKLFNLTNTVSWNRMPSNQLARGFTNTPGAPGPDDDFRIDFPQTQATWTDLKIQNGVLFAAMGADAPLYPPLGDPDGSTSGPGWGNNAVYALPLWQEFYPAGSIPNNTYSDSPNTAAPKNPANGYGYSSSFATNVVWFVGDGYIDNEPGTTFGQVVNIDGENGTGFPSPFTGTGNNGVIKITVGPNSPGGPIDGSFCIAVVTAPAGDIFGIHGTLSFINDTSLDYEFDQGMSWGYLPLPIPPAMPWLVQGDAGSASQNVPAQGFYDSAVYYDGFNLFVAGANQFLESTPTPTLSLGSNGTWHDRTVDGNGNAAFPDFHAINEVDKPDGTREFYVATDGGLWQFQPDTFLWTDLNGNLQAISRINGVTYTTNDPTTSFASVQAGGLVSFSDNQTWGDAQGTGPAQANPKFPPVTLGTVVPTPFNYWPYGASIVSDPNHPGIAYGFVINNAEINPNNDPNAPDWFNAGIVMPTAELWKTTDGGITWNLTGSPFLPISLTQAPDPPMWLDPTNPARLLVGANPNGLLNNANGTFSGAVIQSLNGGATWLGLDPNGLLVDPTTGLPVTITGLAAAQSQGLFKFDTSFPLVNDLGANTYDPATIYVTDGTDVWVTKNLGNVWKLRDPGAPTSAGNIVDLEVDPRNRDLVFALYNNDTLYASFDAGQHWTNISGTGSNKLPTGTPADPINGWKMQIDSRTGFLYVGTDRGVWVSTSGGTSWQQFGIGLAETQVRSMVLNETENTLTVGTYGRGTYQAWLDTSQADGGALAALPGAQALWTGSVQLAGPTTFGATSIYDKLQTGFPIAPASNDQYDAQAIDNGLTTASLNITGTISDQIAGSDWSLNKIGLGNVVIGGSNTFGGTANIAEGALVVHNPAALGQTGVAEVQQITLLDFTPGQTRFYLTFGSVTTPQNNPILYTGTEGPASTPGTDAYYIQTALQTLLTSNGLGGTVSVTVDSTDTVFTVTFGGDLVGFAQPTLQGTVTTFDAGGPGVPGAIVSVASGVQILQFTSPNAGTTSYTLSFNNVSTDTLTYAGSPGPASTPGTDANIIQTALNSLSSIANYNASVQVTADPTDTIFTITYAGTFAGFNRAPLSIQVTSSDGAAATILTLPHGAGGTVVQPQQVLGLQSSLLGEPVQLNGDGTLFDGHYTGSLRNLSNFNTFTGTLILESNATIGVDSGSQLTIAAPGTILDNNNQYTVTKESTGTLVVATANSYGFGNTTTPSTLVNQGTLNIQNPGALGLANNQTEVVNGAQLQVQGGITVVHENLRLTGTGIFNTGALEGTGGANHWQGPVTLAQDPGIVTQPAPPLTLAPPPTSVAIGNLFTSPSDNLTIDGVISQDPSVKASVKMGITKVDSGTVTLTAANTYTGGTSVLTGALRVENPAALGTGAANVSSSAAVELNLDPFNNAITVPTTSVTLNGVGTPEVQVITITGTTIPGATFTIGFKGKATQIAANADASTMQAALNSLPSIGTNGTAVGLTNPAPGVSVFTVLFSGSALAGADQPEMVASSGTPGVTTSVYTLRNGAGGALFDVQGNNTWAGPVLLQTASSVGAAPGSQLTISGSIGNAPATLPNLAPVPAPVLTKASAGTVVLSTDNTYTGQTNVTSGVLNLQASSTSSGSTTKSPLGGNASEVQTVLISGANTGTFTLTFNNGTTSATTVSLAATVPGSGGVGPSASLQNALAALPNIGTGNVTVVQSNNLYTITFTGALANHNWLQLTGQGFKGTVLTIKTIQDGSSGTVVSSGGTLQLQGVPVTTTGVAGVYQFNVTAPFTLSFNGQTTGVLLPTVPATGGVGPTASVQNALAALSTIGGTGNVAVSGANGSFTVTFKGALTGTTIPLLAGITLSTKSLTVAGTGASAVQQFTTNGGPFSLNFNGQITPLLPSGTTPDQVAAALDSLSSIGGVGGSVAVTSNNIQAQTITVTGSGGTFALTFNNGQATGNLAANIPAAGGVGPTASLQNALNALATIGGVGGSVVVSSAPTLNGPAGTVYTIFFYGTLANANQPPLGVSFTGGTVSATDAIINLTVYDVVFGGSLAGTNLPTMTGIGIGPTVNVVAVSGNPNAFQMTPVGGPGGAFTLTFNGATTAPLPYGSTEAQVATALTALPTVSGVSGTAAVSLTNGVYTITFGGTLAGTTLTLTGQGVVLTTTAGGLGALDSAAGVNVWDTPITMTADTSFGSDIDTSTGTLLTATLNIDQPIGQTTAPTNVTKVGFGTVKFSGTTSNTYTGKTTVDDGVLQLAKVGGSVNVTLNNGLYQVTFGGSLANQPLPTMTGTGIGPNVAVTPGAKGSSQQTVGLSSTVGWFTLTFNGQTTAPLAANIPATGGTGATASLQNALVALVGLGNVSVSGGSGTYVVTFKGTLLNTPLLLSGQGVIATTTAGSVSPAVSAVQQFSTTGAFSLTFQGQTTPTLPAGATQAQVQAALNVLSTVTAYAVGNVIIGDGNPSPPSALSDVLQLLNSGQMPATTQATINSDGLFDLNGQQQTLAGLVMTGGTVSDTGSGAQLTVNGPITASSDQFADPSTIQDLGALNLGNTTRTFTISHGNGGTVSVALVNGLYNVTFGGTLANLAVPTMTGAGIGPNVSVTEASGGAQQVNIPAGSVGWYTLTVAGQTTVPLAAGNVPGPQGQVAASAAQVEAALDTALAPYPGASATVLPSGTGFLVSFSDLGVVSNQLSAAGVIATTTPGGIGGVSAVQQFSSNGPFSLSFDGFTTNPLPSNATPTQVQNALNALASVAGVPLYADLVVSAPITGGSGVGLIKQGGGTLALTGINTYPGTTTITQGTLIADGNPTLGNTVGPVVLNGGTLAGTGTVGPVTPTSSTLGGTLLPGDPTPLPAGTITMKVPSTSAAPTWNTKTLLNLTLNHPADGPSSELLLTGPAGNTTTPILNLGGTPIPNPNPVPYPNATGAVLTALLDPNIQIGDTFTILSATNGTIAGRFQEQFGEETPTAGQTVGDGIVFLNGVKFDVHYVNYPSTKQIQLIRALDTATVKVTSSPNPSVFGQHFTYTATVTPEPGTGTLPTTDTVTFYLDNDPAVTINLNGNSTATFDPLNYFSPTTTYFAPGPHTVKAVFNADGHDVSFRTDEFGTATQTIAKASSAITITSSPTNPIPGQTVTVTAAVSAAAPGAGTPTGTVSFSLDGTTLTGTVTYTTVGSNLVATTVLPFLNASLHVVKASYSGDNFFNSTTTGTGYNINVVKGNPTVTLTANPIPNPGSFFGQAVIFSVTLSGAVAGQPTPTGNVTFYNGSVAQANILGSGSLVGGTVTIPAVTTLSVANHVINITYTGNTSYNAISTTPAVGYTTVGGAINPYIVSKANTTTTLTASTTADNFGTPVTFTVTVAPVAPGAGSPSGTVTFSDTLNGVTTALTPTEPLTASDVATLVANSFQPGTHIITATYNGDNNFASSKTGNTVATGAISLQVAVATTTTVKSSLGSPSIYGQAVTFTAAVAAQAPAKGNPTAPDTVTFTDTVNGVTTTYSGITLNSSGIATLAFPATSPSSTLSAGSHSIQATFVPAVSDSTYFGSSGTTSQVVNKASTTIVPFSPGASVYGQPLNLTATINVTPPGGGIPGGTVTFYDGPVFNNVVLGGGAATVSTSNGITTASISTNALSVNTHTINVVYSGDSNFSNSSTAFTQTVSITPTSTTLSASASPTPPVAGQTITLVATVTPTYVGPNAPSGSVTFVNGNATLATINVSTSNGVTTATLMTTALGAGTYTITASYSGDSNYKSSQTGSSGAASVTLNKDNSNTVISATPNPAVPGATVTYTATVTAASPGSGTPTGTVLFTYDGSNSLGSASLQVVNGVNIATVTSNSLVSGPHTITAQYNDDSNFFGSSNTYSQTILYPSVVTDSSPGTPSFYGQTVTFTATVTAAAPNSGLTPPDGELVTFLDGATGLGTGTLSSGVATFSTSALGVGSHTINARFAQDATFTAGSTAQGASQVVNQTATTTTVSFSSSNSPNDPVSGQTITLTATVAGAFTGPSAPSGSVQFFSNGASVGNGILSTSSGVTTATITTSALMAGSYTITANYSGDINYLKSQSGTSGAASITVDRDNSNTVVSSSAPSATLGSTVTITATVTAASPGSGTPTGTVNFFYDSNTTAFGSGTLAVVNGLNIVTATISTNTLGFGPHTIYATYQDDSNFLPSTSPNFTEHVLYNTSTAVSSSPSPTYYGITVTLTATVTPGPSSVGNPSGSVTFYDGTASLGNGTLSTSSGVTTATFTTSTLSPGDHTITATYNGDTAFGSSTSAQAVTETINKATTSTSLAVTPSGTIYYGELLSFTATVTVTNGAGAPTGQVAFVDGSTTLGTISVSTTNGVSTAVLPYSLLSVGATHNVTAQYQGDSNFAASNVSNSQSITVQSDPTTTTLGSSVGSGSVSSVYGQTVTLSATVTAKAPGGGVPGGTVTFSSGSTTLGTGNVGSNGVATLAVSFTTLGTQTITASYGGSSSYLSSATGNTVATGALSLTVSKANTNVVISSSNSSSFVGQAVTITATVTAASPGSGTPTGTVNFFDGTTKIGSGTLSNGIATFVTSSLSATTHNISATYADDNNFNGNSSSVLKQTVTAQTLKSLSATLNPTNPVQSTAFSLTVTGLDVNGIQDYGDNASVAISIVSMPTGATLTGLPSKAPNLSAGTYTFSNLTASKTGTYTILIASGGITKVVTITVVASGRQT
jgi:autotransporter-associated beta strand protein